VSAWARATVIVVCMLLFVMVVHYGITQFKMQVARLRGEKVEEVKPAYQPPKQLIQMLAITGVIAAMPAIMWRVYCEKTRLLGVVKPKDFNRHLLFFGPTGSGKTTTALKAIELSLKNDVSVTVIDWKGEYSGKIAGATVIRKFNLLEPPDWSNVELHAMVVTDILRDVLGLTEPMCYALYEELSQMYEERVASFARLLELVKARRGTMLAMRNYAEARIAEGLIRRLLPLVLDERRSAKNLKGSDKVVIYDLSELPTHQLRALYAEIILWRLYNEARRNGSTLQLKKLIIAEESQNYVRPRRPEQPPSIGERIVNELRAYGYGCLLISPDPYQLPLHMSRDVAAVISIGYQALPEVILDVLTLYRYADIKKLVRTASRPRTYIYYDGRLHIKGLPKPYLRVIDLGTEQAEEVVKPVEPAEEKAEAGEAPEPIGGAHHHLTPRSRFPPT